MKTFYLSMALISSFSLFAGGNAGDGPIRKLNVNEIQTGSKYKAFMKDEDCDRCEGDESYNRMMELIKRDEEKYMESLSSEILKGFR